MAAAYAAPAERHWRDPQPPALPTAVWINLPATKVDHGVSGGHLLALEHLGITEAPNYPSLVLPTQLRLRFQTRVMKVGMTRYFGMTPGTWLVLVGVSGIGWI